MTKPNMSSLIQCATEFDVDGEYDAGTESDRSDEELIQSIAALTMRGTTSVDKIAKALDAPTSEIAAFLRRKKNQTALLLIHGVADHMVGLTEQAYKIQEKVGEEIVRRLNDPEVVAKMETKDLANLWDKMTKFVSPIQAKVALPSGAKINLNLGNDNGPNPDLVRAIADTAHVLKTQLGAREQETLDMVEVKGEDYDQGSETAGAPRQAEGGEVWEGRRDE